MTDYTFKADIVHSSRDWTDPNAWTGGVSPNAADADVVIPTTINLYTGEPFISSITIASTSSITANSLSIENNKLFIDGNFAVSSQIENGSGGKIFLDGGVLNAGSINNHGEYLTGSGVVNAGIIVNTGEVSGGGGNAADAMTINADYFESSGSIQSWGGMHINIEGGNFSNLSNGVLSGSVFTAWSQGPTSVDDGLYLNVGDTISSIDTTVNLNYGGMIYSFDDATSQFLSLGDTLQTVASNGVLNILAGQPGAEYHFNTLDIEGEVHLSTGFYNWGDAKIFADAINIHSGGLIEGYGVVSASVVNDGVISAIYAGYNGEVLTIAGPITGDGEIRISSGIEGKAYMPKAIVEVGQVSEGQHVVFATNIGQLTLTDPAGFHGTIVPSIEGHQGSQGDTILIKDMSLSSVTSYNYLGSASEGDLTLTAGGNSLTLHFQGNFTTQSFTLAEGPRNLSTDPESVLVTVNAGVGTLPPLCFVAGTLIRTVDGDVPVERLRIGDKAITASGQARPIRWVGCRRLDGIGDSAHADSWPVRVLAGAFGPDQPSRDLYLSPGHAICVTVLDALFIPVDRLINDATIARIAVEQVDYWHVELDDHDVLLANNLPAESYMDAGNRHWFAGADTGMEPARAQQSLADYARPFVDAGPVVDAVRVRLAERARTAGWTISDDMAPHLIVDGQRVEGDRDGRLIRFLFPADAQVVRLQSASFVPQQQGMGADDRRLGVAIMSLMVDDGLRTRADISLHDPLLDSLHPLEQDGELQWRWTRGAMPLPAALWQDCKGHVMLKIDMLPRGGRRWIAPADAGGYRSPAERTAEIVRLRA
ncbi:MAG: Hint domain-containing protein [Sphingobium yanoikuyae]|uniref:Hint domain-containing protein n=1 Tax=Sphingobium yanoikuyae TaxID=13690 RepID=UPI001B1CDF3E|nr:Hint domain-containing protein [Sphingobium yanoikuyae]